MKLLNLATIVSGKSLGNEVLTSNYDGTINDYMYWDENMLAKKAGASFIRYVREKDIRKYNLHYVILNYGDYILYRFEDSYHLFRYSEVNKRSIAGENTIIIRPEFAILIEFFGYEKNKKFFLRELTGRLNTGGSIVELAGEIELPVDNILELEQANVAERLGIVSKVPDVSQINIIQKSIPMDKLMKRIVHGELILDSDFQRKPGLWTLDVKSRLIESMIVKIPIPAFYFDGDNDNRWQVIDGLQRLSAVHSYINDQFRLTGLDYLENKEGLKFSELDRIAQRNIEEYEAYAYILQKGTPPSVKYKIFKSINTSSLKLRDQEIRHAINPGVPANLLKEIAESEWFQSGVEIGDAGKDRMEDREVVLRYIAFKRTPYNKYRPEITDFLDQAMTDIYDIPVIQQNLIKDELRNILATIRYLFHDENPFSRSIIEQHRAFSHNNIIFETLTYCFSKIATDDLKKMIPLRDAIRKKIQDFYQGQTSRFWEYEYAYSQKGVTERFQNTEVLIKEIKSMLNDN